MAEEKQDAEGSGGGKMKLIIIAAVVIIIGAAAAFFLLGGEDEAAPEDAAKENVSKVKQPAIYYSIEKPIIVNFSKQSKNAVRYLSVKIKVMARDQAVIDAFTLHQPAMQHELGLLMFSQKYDDLNTSAGKKALKQQSLDKVNEVLDEQDVDGKIEAVYITNLIMQ